MSVKFDYLHVPKTGGTWLLDILKRHNIIADRPYHWIPGNSLNHPTLAFYRDPVSWYECWYNFIKYGSDRVSPSTAGRQMMHAADSKLISSQEYFFEMLLRPTRKYRTRLASVTGVSEHVFAVGWLFTLAKTWDDSTDFYTHMMQSYLQHATTIEPVSNLRRGTLTFLSSHTEVPGTLRDQLLSAPPINVTTKKETLKPEIINEIRTATRSVVDAYEHGDQISQRY